MLCCGDKVGSCATPDQPNRKPQQGDSRDDKDQSFDSLKEREPLGRLIGLQDLDSVLVPAGLQIEVPPASGCQACVGNLVELARADAVAMHVDRLLVAHQPRLTLA